MDSSPVRSACAHCSAARSSGVDRRTFLSAATVAAVSALLQACGSSKSVDFFTGPAGGSLAVELSDFPVLATIGGLARVDNGSGAPTALVRTGTSSFLGVTMICTHQGATIDVTGTSFRCPNHGALFSGTGVWQGGQPTTSLATYTATFDGLNTVTIARP